MDIPLPPQIWHFFFGIFPGCLALLAFFQTGFGMKLSGPSGNPETGHCHQSSAHHADDVVKVLAMVNYSTHVYKAG